MVCCADQSNYCWTLKTRDITRNIILTAILLNREQFLEVIDRTPLVSVDLVIRDSQKRTLLGRRVNEPEKGKWFVPGGRIMKGESLNDAFERITKAEIGIKHSRIEARLIGAYSHLYDTNVFLEDGISTHYVVLAYELHLADNLIDDLNEMETSQHSKYNWFAREEVESTPEVHEYVLEYFRVPSLMNEKQYQFLNARRDSFNTLVWQTPVLSMTAQAFLFTIILSVSVPEWGRIIAAILASISSLFSLQLFAKHRFMEEQHARILHAYEEIHKLYAANRAIRSPNWSLRSSYMLCRFLLWAFFIAAIYSAGLGWFGLLNK